MGLTRVVGWVVVMWVVVGVGGWVGGGYVGCCGGGWVSGGDVGGGGVGGWGCGGNVDDGGMGGWVVVMKIVNYAPIMLDAPQNFHIWKNC